MLERLIATVREIAEGLSHPAYGCCSGDPIAWEKDLLRQKAESAGRPARLTAASRDTAAAAAARPPLPAAPAH
jgi:hypothetical protein